ncbi:DNA glycosylase AlkZ-like family protein [Cellulomonas sp. P24]|uniref:DNA glycosylase AlkZ-like family protein n=1 Tax=Cellulomonas sp. P24 TaxID=2885206 RepID=UPI0028704C53|nr:crosslink repair DNA glycosylase YcaQ family protein [Cellulomonas sp. P24]
MPAGLLPDQGEPARQAISELVEAGTLRQVRVAGWNRSAYLHAEATLPRRATASTLVSPFDPLVFERRRLLELFGMHYRIEIYVPAPQRVHGYYVLPFLHGEQLPARVDLKADRRTGRLLVVAAHAEDGAADETPVALAAELRRLAGWLGLDEVVALDGDGRPARGGLATSLAGALSAT